MSDTKDSVKPEGGNPPNQDQENGQSERPAEHGGRKGLEPTRYGDWEKNGRCIDF